MIGATAVIKHPARNSVKMYTLDKKAPSGIQEAKAAVYAKWNFGEARTEMFNGRYGLHFAVDLPAEIRLDNVHLIFAGGTR